MTAEPGLYRLHFKSHKFILLSLDKENIKVNADWNNIDQYTVNGSPASENLRNLIAVYRDQMRDFHTMNIVMDTLKAKGNDSMLANARKDIADMNQKFTRYIENFADTTPYLPNAIFAARMLNPTNEITYLDQFTQSLTRRFPGKKMSKDFAEYFLKINAVPVKQNIKKANLNIGETAPDINLFNAARMQVSLTAMRGKYVLIDFWASFCPPCRAENPDIVALYKKYKSKNFAIYGVSLDDNHKG
jgi:thiol-disulfide isomerase/thioredoxin